MEATSNVAQHYTLLNDASATEFNANTPPPPIILQQTSDTVVAVQASNSANPGSSEPAISQPFLPIVTSRQSSPALSSTSSLTNISSTLSPVGLVGTTQSTCQPSASDLLGQPPKKRRKLTPAEKQQRLQDKELKDREKAEHKAKREEEKQVKDEERRQKNEIKEAKRREKEVEKERKDQEKRRIEEEKEKKERAQPRMTAFFAKPSPTSSLSNSGSSLLAQNIAVDPSTNIDASESKLDSDTFKSDYKSTFLPFSLASNTTLASTSRFDWDDGAVKHVEDAIERSLDSNVHVTLLQALEQPPYMSVPRGLDHRTIKEIVKQVSLSGSDSAVAANTTDTIQDPLTELRSIPMKLIFFNEDVRPPYHGTYTKLSRNQLSRAGRNPFLKVRLDTDYNYDSEAEWEEPEEGEDLLSEGDSDAESADETDEMDDFLDDEGVDGHTVKRKLISGDLEPVCSGLIFENLNGLSLSPNGRKSDLCRYQMELLHDAVRLPIDPFSSSYWASPPREKAKASTASVSEMKPPRQPLQAKPNFFSNMQIEKDASKDERFTKPRKGPSACAGRLLEGQELDNFKKAVSESEHTKVGLLAILKKQFPKVPRLVLKDTLTHVAERQGLTEAEKRWKLKPLE